MNTVCVEEPKIKELLCKADLPLVLLTPSTPGADFVQKFEKALSDMAGKSIEIKTFIDVRQKGPVIFLSRDLKLSLDIRESFLSELERKFLELKGDVEALRADDIKRQLKDIIEATKPKFRVTDIRNEGTVLTVGDGTARVAGLTNVGSQEVVEFEGGIYGLAFSLEKESVGCVLLGPEEDIPEGSKVVCTGKLLEIPVGEAMLGSIVNAVGVPIDGKGKVLTTKTRQVERKAPGLTL